MKTQTKLLLCAAALTLFFFPACQDDDGATGPSGNNYAPQFLSVGNYWVYERYSVNDTTGEAIASGELDTVRIIGTETIDGEEYYEFTGTDFLYVPEFQYLRDSAGYLLLPGNRAIYAPQTDPAVLFSGATVNAGGEPLFELEFRMNGEALGLQTPAGSFDCLDVLGEVTFFDPDYPWPEREIHSYIDPAIGIVSTRWFFYNAPYLTEYRLVDYEVK